jgi:ADP-ribose pyrophosphatase YjhB (NUDIX family)
VAVDVALLTVADDQLCVLLHQGRSLPGTFLRVEETLRDAALRVLREKAGVTGEEPRQLAVFDDPARDDRGRVLSVAHVDLVPAARLTGALTPVDALPPLAFDHAAIVDAAAAWARDAHRDRPDPRGLLDEEFTLLELQRLHEAVRGGPLPKDTFRRRMQEHLIDTGTLSRGTVGKPARVFRRAPQETP